MAYTIVSACFWLPNRGHDYISLCTDLLNSSASKIVFMDSIIKKQLNLSDGFNGKHTFIVPFEFSELAVFANCADLSRLQICESSNPVKDSVEYFAVIANKTKWVAIASQLDIFQTDHFIWIDFGLSHIFSQPAALSNLLTGLRTYFGVVRIGSIWDPNRVFDTNWLAHRQPMWAFAGGVFGGDKKSIALFDDLYQKKLADLLSRNQLTWEVNIYYLVYKESPELFSPYACDHNFTLLGNY